MNEWQRFRITQRRKPVSKEGTNVGVDGIDRRRIDQLTEDRREARKMGITVEEYRKLF